MHDGGAMADQREGLASPRGAHTITWSSAEADSRLGQHPLLLIYPHQLKSRIAHLVLSQCLQVMARRTILWTAQCGE